MEWKKKWDIDKNGKADIETDIDIDKNGIVIKIKALSGWVKAVIGVVIIIGGYLIGHYGGLW